MTSGSASAGARSTWCWDPLARCSRPLENLGLIIMDEEQESSYQSENALGYHARDVAKYRCVREKAGAGVRLRHPYGGDRPGAPSRELSQALLLRGATTSNACREVTLADLRRETAERQRRPDQRARCGGSWRRIWRRGSRASCF
ncbi:MAG: hypothetical protein ACLU38_03695 [Dysosmobacter sp.]